MIFDRRRDGRMSAGFTALKSRLASAGENPGGEWTLRIQTFTDADAVSILFQLPPRGVRTPRRTPLRQKITYDPRRPVEAFQAQLPPEVRWKADNYNHLMEQPTLFYAVALTLGYSAPTELWNTALAWGYVGLRVVHSLVQATVNVILVRFAIFMAATVVLLVLSLRAAWIVL